MNYNLAFYKGTCKSERWGCQPHVKWSRSLYPTISPLLVSKTRERTRKLWFPLSAKGSSWFDNVFKPVHPELPRGWTLLSCLCCGHLALFMEGLAWPAHGWGWPVHWPSTLQPEWQLGFRFSALPFTATCKPPTGPSSHSTWTFFSFLRLQQEHIWMLGAFVHIFLDSLQKEKRSRVRTNGAPSTSKNRFQILKICLLITIVMLEALYASSLELPVASAAILL